MEEHNPQITTPVDPVPAGTPEHATDNAAGQTVAEPQAQADEVAPQKAKEEEQLRPEAVLQQQAKEAEARQREEKEALDRRAEEERRAGEERESEEKRQLAAAKAKLREEAEAALKAAGGGSGTTDNEGAKNKAVKELKTALDEHRRRYDRGKKLWRAWSLLSLHILILSIAGAIFVNWSASVIDNDPSGRRADIVFGLVIVAIISLILSLEYLRNWWNFNVRLNQVDRLSIGLTNSDVKLDDIRTKLEK